MLYKDNVGDIHDVKREYKDIVKALDNLITDTSGKKGQLHIDLVNVWDTWVSNGKLGD